MALDTFANLKAAITNRIDRTDMADEVVDYITIAETDICRWLRVMWNQKRAYAVPTDAYVALPSDFLGMSNIQWNANSQRYNLEQLSAHMLDQVSPSTASGQPCYYAVHDDQIELRPAPALDNTAEVEIAYYFKPAVLSDSNTSNEILVNAPDLLFYRACAEAFDHLFDEQRSVKYMQLYERAKKIITDDDRKRKWSKTPMRSRVDSLQRISGY